MLNYYIYIPLPVLNALGITMKFKKNKPSAGGPSSSIGIMRFFDTDIGGPKLTPEFITIAAAAFIVIVLVVKLFRIF